MMKALVLALSITALLAPSTALADNYEIQVYGYKTAEPGETMIELHSNFTAKGTRETVDRVLPTRHQVHETLEITHGWTPWFETGFYVFTNIQPHGSWDWVGDHIRPRFRAPDEWQLPVGLSLSFEFGYVRPEYSTDQWTLEIRPIIDKEIGPWYLAFNPVFARSIKGENSHRGFDFSPNVKVSYQLTKVVAVGFEYYGDMGPFGNFDPLHRQAHVLYPAVDLDLDPKWELNFGVGFALTGASDSYIIKAIVGRRFNFFGK